MSNGTIEIITGRERRRRWSVEEKLRIVAETEGAGARVTEVAARRRLSWAAVHLAAAGSGWRVGSTAGRDIHAGADVGDGEAVDPESRHPTQDERSRPVAAPYLRDGTIEITLANGCRLLVDQQIDARALRRIVGVLRG